MSAEQRWIRSLCVLGGGITGFSAALAFARALPDGSLVRVKSRLARYSRSEASAIQFDPRRLFSISTAY